MLTPEERTRLFDAMNSMKRRMIDNITAWDLHTLVHYPDSAPGRFEGSGTTDRQRARLDLPGFVSK